MYGLINGMDPQGIVDLATACGALKQSINGDWAIISLEEAKQFIHRGPSGRIIR